MQLYSDWTRTSCVVAGDRNHSKTEEIYAVIALFRLDMQMMDHESSDYLVSVAKLSCYWPRWFGAEIQPMWFIHSGGGLNINAMFVVAAKAKQQLIKNYTWRRCILRSLTNPVVKRDC